MSQTDLDVLTDQAWQSAAAVQHLLGGVAAAATGSYEGQDPDGAVTCRISGAGRTESIILSDGWRSRIASGSELAAAVMAAYRAALDGYWSAAFGPVRDVGTLAEVDVPPEARSRLRAEARAGVEALLPSFDGAGTESLEQINAQVRQINTRLASQLAESRQAAATGLTDDPGDPTVVTATPSRAEPVVAQRHGDLVIHLAIDDGWARSCPAVHAAGLVARAMRGERVQDLDDSARDDVVDLYDPTNPFQERNF